MIFGPHKRLLAWVVEADRRYGRSGISICGLHGTTIGQTSDTAVNLKTLRSKVSLFAYPSSIGIYRQFLGNQGTILRVYGHCNGRGILISKL